jgi:hypothetical protein
MADDFLRRVDQSSKNWYGAERPLERIVDDFSLHGPSKRIESLEQMDEHIQNLSVETGESSLRDYARLVRLKRATDTAHQTLLKVGR